MLGPSAFDSGIKWRFLGQEAVPEPRWLFAFPITMAG